MSNQNYYKANLRDLTFLLFEQFKLDELLGKEPYPNWGRDEVEAVLQEAYAWVQKHMGPHNRTGDAEGGNRFIDSSRGLDPRAVLPDPGTTEQQPGVAGVALLRVDLHSVRS